MCMARGKERREEKGAGEAVKTAQSSIMQPRINSGRNLQELGAGQRLAAVSPYGMFV